MRVAVVAFRGPREEAGPSKRARKVPRDVVGPVASRIGKVGAAGATPGEIGCERVGSTAPTGTRYPVQSRNVPTARRGGVGGGKTAGRKG